MPKKKSKRRKTNKGAHAVAPTAKITERIGKVNVRFIQFIIKNIRRYKLFSTIILGAIGSLICVISYGKWIDSYPIVISPTSQSIGASSGDTCIFSVYNRSQKPVYGLELSISIKGRKFTSDDFVEDTKNTSFDLYNSFSPGTGALRFSMDIKGDRGHTTFVHLLRDPIYYEKRKKRLHPYVGNLAPGHSATVAIAFRDEIAIKKQPLVELVADKYFFNHRPMSHSTVNTSKRKIEGTQSDKAKRPQGRIRAPSSHH